MVIRDKSNAINFIDYFLQLLFFSLIPTNSSLENLEIAFNICVYKYIIIGLALVLFHYLACIFCNIASDRQITKMRFLLDIKPLY